MRPEQKAETLGIDVRVWVWLFQCVLDVAVRSLNAPIQRCPIFNHEY